MARGGSAGAHEPEEEQICPLCINELDETEKAWLPCSCGYQLCLFCYDRLKTEFSNRCPNCRVDGSPPRHASAGVRRLAPIVASRSLHAEPEASSSSSADTAATTPQSPASSVVCFRAAQVQPPPGCSLGLRSQPGLAGKPLVGAAVAQAPVAVHGRCAVVLPRCGSDLGVEPDPEGASLAASLQEAVRAGSLSVKQAAASLASYLRQRQHAAAAAAIATAVAGSASSSPARVGGQPSSAGSTGSPLSGNLTPFTMPASALAAAAAAAAGSGSGMLRSESSLLLPCDSSQSVATSATLSHWAHSGSLPMPEQSPLGSSTSWRQHQHQQQHQQVVGSPVRDNDKLPLFMRRGTLRAGAALAGSSCGGGGSPSSTASQASSAGSGSFPGFPSRSGSPTPEPAKRVIAPPPGFGPTLGAAGIAALPRFR
ncbi:hypothetical protein ABPG77_005120 [Micractinium sp. CCAP 211/92]